MYNVLYGLKYYIYYYARIAGGGTGGAYAEATKAATSPAPSAKTPSWGDERHKGYTRLRECVLRQYATTRILYERDNNNNVYNAPYTAVQTRTESHTIIIFVYVFRTATCTRVASIIIYIRVSSALCNIIISCGTDDRFSHGPNDTYYARITLVGGFLSAFIPPSTRFPRAVRVQQ
uniref:Uncharacterized protein n=1 Tax=Schizaphis graminum TaxID=13262 RepID=A0A2S2PD98_SCHGA